MPAVLIEHYFHTCHDDVDKLLFDDERDKLAYTEDPDVPDSDRKLFVAKSKDGELGRLTFGFEPKRMTFTYRSHRTDEPRPNRTARKPAEAAPAPRLYEISEPLFNTGAREREVQEVFGGSTDNKKNG